VPTDPLTASRYPSLSSAVNVPQDIQNAVYDLSDNTIPYFTSTTARTSAYSAWVSSGGVMRNGLYCHVNGLGLCRYNAGTAAWQDSSQPATLPVLTNWSSVNTGEQTATYWRDYKNVVYVSGSVKNTGGAGGGYTPGTSISFATLPAGFRPSGWVNFDVQVTASQVNLGGDLDVSGNMRMIRGAGPVPIGTVHSFSFFFVAA